MGFKIWVDIFALLLSGFSLWYTIRARREFLKEKAEIELKIEEAKSELEKINGFLVI